ncbi:MAG: PAS domain S-box protein [Gemmatimonadota bacterium]|nr:PAS domain S-box protein [Gemmatimonadota bacterium]
MGERKPVQYGTDSRSGSNGHPRTAVPPASEQASDRASSPAPPPLESKSSGADPRDPVFIVRETGEILFANCALGGRSEEDVVGSSLFDWIPGDQQELVSEALARAFGTATVQRHELAGLQQHDPDAWYDCRLTPNIRDGNVVSVTLVAHDITQYKRSSLQLEATCRDLQRLLDERSADLARANSALAEESKAREAREREWRRFRTLMDQAGEAVFVSDPRTEKIIDLNETAARWIGRTRDEAIGRRIHELQLEFPVQPPVEAELEFTETRDTRRPLLLDGAHRRRDGSSFPVEVAVARHTIGDQSYVLAVARDVKERSALDEQLRQAEERYGTLFEQCWDAIYLTARDGRIEEVNGSAVQLFGYPKSEFLGLDARQLFARAVDIRRFQVQMTTLGTVGDLEVELLTNSGKAFPALLSATLRAAPTGVIRGYQCIVRPVSLPEAGESAPSAEADTGGTIVLAGVSGDLADANTALAAAGLRVMASDTIEGALEMIDRGGSAIQTAVFDAETAGDDLRRHLEAVRRSAPDMRLLLLTGGEPVAVAECVADLGIRSILRKPIHPLALIQKIREA